MDRLTKFFIKKSLKKQGLNIIDKIEGVNLQDGIYLNVFNTGVKVNLSKIIKKVREYGVKEARKRLKKF